MFKKILTLLLSNLKLIFVKLFHPKSFSYHPYNNISPLSIIEISQKGSIKLGKKLIVKRNTRIAANRGKISIGQNSGIGSNCYIVSHDKITIGKNVFIGPNVVIVDHDHKFDENGIRRKEFTSKSVVIEDGAWIGANSVILKGIKVGANSIIAAGSVVSKNVPARTIFVQKRKTDFIKIDGAGNEKD